MKNAQTSFKNLHLRPSSAILRHGVRPTRGLRLAVLAALVAAGPAAGAADNPPLPVVTSFSILHDIIQQIGGDRVAVQSLVPAGGDTHVFQPGPSHVRQLAAAQLVVINGLGFEGWMPRLIGSSGYKGMVVEAARGVSALKAEDHHHHGGKGTEADHGHAHDHEDDAHEAGHDAHGGGDEHHEHGHGNSAGSHDHDHAPADRKDHAQAHGHDHGELDPHAWQDVQNVRRYVANILKALCAAVPADCAGFRQRAGAYDQKLQQLDQEIRRAVGSLPPDRRSVMVSHSAFGYYAKAYGITFMAPVGVSTEAEPSAAVVGRLIREARRQQIRAFFFESNSDRRLLQRMAAEMKDVTIGELYADTLSREGGPAADYLSLMRFNTQAITQALQRK